MDRENRAIVLETDLKAICPPEAIVNHLKALKIPQISKESLFIAEQEKQGAGGHGEIYLYQLKVELETADSGHYDSVRCNWIPQNPRKASVLIPAIAKKTVIQLMTSPTLFQIQQLTHQFLQEMRALKAAQDQDNPNVIGLYGYYYDDTPYTAPDYIAYPVFSFPFWIIMQYAEYGSLMQSLTKAQFNLFDRIHITANILESLEKLLVKNILHGDLKPENIVLDKNYHPYWVDFGCATLATTKIFLFTCKVWAQLEQQKNISQYLPAMIQQQHNAIRFVVPTMTKKKTNGLMLTTNELQGQLTLIKHLDCPAHLLSEAQSFMQQYHDHANQNASTAVDLPLSHSIIRFLLQNEYYPALSAYMTIRDNECPGTTEYLAPELIKRFFPLLAIKNQQLEENPQKDLLLPNQHTEVYAFGILLYQLFAHWDPYPNEYTKFSGGPSTMFIMNKVLNETLRPPFNLNPQINKNGCFSIAQALKNPENDQELIPINTLSIKDQHRLNTLKKHTEACWHADPMQRPTISILSDFFKNWRDDLLRDMIIFNNEPAIQYLIKIRPSFDWFLRKNNAFQDQPLRNPANDISLFSYCLWAHHPMTEILFEVMNYRLAPKIQAEMFQTLANAHPWIKKNGSSVLVIIENLIKHYNDLQKIVVTNAQDNAKRTCWHKISQQQSKLPPYLLFDYCKIQNQKNMRHPTHEKPEACSNQARNTLAMPDFFIAQQKEIQMNTWYKKSGLVSSEIVQYNASYYKDEALYSKAIKNSDTHIQFEGLDTHREIDVFTQLMEELQKRSSMFSMSS